MPDRGPSFRQRHGKRPAKAIRGEILLDDRDRKQVRRRKERKMLGVAFVIGLAVSIVGLYFSPFLRVQEVSVTGTSQLDPGEVAALADIDGQSMVSSTFSGAEARIAALPQVRSRRDQAALAGLCRDRRHRARALGHLVRG